MTNVRHHFSISNFQLAVYPNPTNGSINITVNEDALSLSKGLVNITITDISGRKIFSAPITLSPDNSITLSTLEIENGSYFISLFHNGSLIAAERLFIAK